MASTHALVGLTAVSSGSALAPPDHHQAPGAGRAGTTHHRPRCPTGRRTPRRSTRGSARRSACSRGTPCACRASTRPRISGRPAICTIAVDAVRKAMLPRPTNSPTGTGDGQARATRASASIGTPKASAVRATMRTSIDAAAGRGQRTDQRADADDREQDGEGGVGAAEVLGDEQREHDREVEGERADDRHHHQRHPQVGDAARVAQARRGPGPWPGAATGDGRSSEVRIIASADEHGDVGEAVDEERPAEADGGDEQAGERGTDDPGRGHERRC